MKMICKHAFAAIVLGLVLPVAGCSDSDSDGPETSTEASEATEPSETAESPVPPEIDGPVGPLQFKMATSDGAIEVDGTAESCDNPDEESLTTTFTDGATTVSIDASGGGGQITVSGGTELEGAIESLQVGDDGSVSITGTGTAADDSAEPTAFAILGSCQAPAASSDENAASAESFTFETGDGATTVEGPAGDCQNPDEETLKVSFEGDGTTVDVDVTGGSGGVRLSGATEFEGTVDSASVGDDGSVTVSGKGSLADPGAAPTTFTVTGSCGG